MYLGIDVGTSEVKVALVDGAQRLLAVGRAALDVARPHPLWSEQDPQSWVVATQAAIAELRAGHGAELAKVTGIGLSGQMHGAVLLDAHDRVLRPAILWNDTRSAAECAVLEARVPEARRLTGNMAMPGFTAPKLLWVATHEPEIFGRTAKVLLPKDYVRLWLTGEHVSEMSDAAGTLWLDVERREWCDPMLAADWPRPLSHAAARRGFGAPAWFCARSSRAAGAWRVQWSLPEAPETTRPAPWASGLVTEGQGFLSLGTSGVFFVARDAYRPAPERGVHTFCHALTRHVAPDGR